MKIYHPELFKQKPNAVFFDLDHTLYDYPSAHEAGMAASEHLAADIIGTNAQQFQVLFAQAREIVKHRVGDVAASHSRLLYFQALIEKAGLKTQAQSTLQLEQCYWHHYLASMKLYPGVTELLAELKMKNIPTCIVSDLTAQIQLRKLMALKLDSYIDYLVTSEEAGREKPNEKPFLLALEKCGLDRSAHIWMIGDSIERDIEGAKNAINAITLQKIESPFSLLHHTIQDASFHDFHALINLMEQFDPEE